MAEGWARSLKSAKIEAYSAGTVPQGINLLAVKVMKEAGIDIGSQVSKCVDDLLGINFDYVVTVCDAEFIMPCLSWKCENSSRWL